MKIGIIGCEATIQTVKNAISSEIVFDELTEIPCEAENVGQVVEQSQPKLDVILFTGYLSFFHACQNVVATIPWSYAKRSGYSATQALLKASIKGTNISHITYDLSENPVVQLERIISDNSSITHKDMRLLKYVDNKFYTRTEDNYVHNALAFHRENLRSGKATLCLSGMADVVQALREEGYSAELVCPTDEELKQQIIELRLRYQIRKEHQNSDMSFAVLAFRTGVAENYNPEFQRYMKMSIAHQVETCVFNFAQMLGAAMEINGNGYYMLYTTKVELSIVTQNFSTLFLLQDIRPILSIARINIGIGIGSTHAMAKENAEQAVIRAERFSKSCYYIMESGGVIAGPFGSEEDDNDKLLNRETISRISCETGVGIPVIMKLLRVQKQYKFDTITPAELAVMCNMTQSNMNRVLAKLEASNYAVTTGYQPVAGPGRPRRIIRLSFIAEML